MVVCANHGAKQAVVHRILSRVPTLSSTQFLFFHVHTIVNYSATETGALF